MNSPTLIKALCTKTHSVDSSVLKVPNSSNSADVLLFHVTLYFVIILCKLNFLVFFNILCHFLLWKFSGKQQCIASSVF